MGGKKSQALKRQHLNQHMSIGNSESAVSHFAARSLKLLQRE
jgi:hypothetical protein